MLESGPNESGLEINENIKSFLEDLPREKEGEKKHNVSPILGKDGSCLLVFSFDKDVTMIEKEEESAVTVKLSFTGEDKQCLEIESITDLSTINDVSSRFLRMTLLILKNKAKGKFSKIKANNMMGKGSLWIDNGFTKCEGENNNFELDLK